MDCAIITLKYLTGWKIIPVQKGFPDKFMRKGLGLAMDVHLKIENALGSRGVILQQTAEFLPVPGGDARLKQPPVIGREGADV